MNDSQSPNTPENNFAPVVAAPVRKPFRLQFSLLGLLGLTTVVCIATGLLFAVPPEIGSLAAVGINIALPVVLTTVAMHGRGYQRTFCVGALFPAGVALTGIGISYSYAVLVLGIGFMIENADLQWRIANAMVWGMIPACGLLAVVVRRIVEQREPQS